MIDYGCGFPWQWKTGVGNYRQSVPSDARSGWEFWTRVGEGFHASSESWVYVASKAHQKFQWTVRLKFQTEWRAFCLSGAKNPWQQPFALWAAQKPGSEIPSISNSTFQRGTEKQGSEIAGNCQQLPRRFPPQPYQSRWANVRLSLRWGGHAESYGHRSVIRLDRSWRGESAAAGFTELSSLEPFVSLFGTAAYVALHMPLTSRSRWAAGLLYAVASLSLLAPSFIGTCSQRRIVGRWVHVGWC